LRQASEETDVKNWRATAGSGAGRRGFTIIEIMVTVAIIAILFGVGVPSVWRAMQKDQLTRAVRDTVEGCKAARDRAILQGVPYEFIVKSDGSLDVAVAAVAGGPPARESGRSTGEAPYAAFPRKLGEDIMIQLIGVNFIDLMQAEESRVRFYPNGTCDEFTVVYAWKGRQRTVKTDIITGQPEELTQ